MKELILRRPALCLAAAFGSGIAIANWSGVECVVPSAVAALLLVAVGIFSSNERLASAATIFAVAFSGCFSCALRERSMNHDDLRVLLGERSARVWLRADLLQTPAWIIMPHGSCGTAEYRGTAMARVREINTERGWQGVRGKVRATFVVENPPGMACGDLLQLYGTIRPMRAATNPGQFDARSFWHGRGVDYSLSVGGESQIEILCAGCSRRFFRFAESVRNRLRKGLEMGVPECPERDLIAAMVLGFRENMAEALVRDFQITNTYHIVAISGLHVAFVYLMVSAVLKAALIPARIAAMVSIPVIAAYAVLAGGNAPVTRAAVMFSSFLAAPFFGRRGDTMNAMGIAALALLAANPLTLFETGFQLSFAAVISIVALSPPLYAIFLRRWPCAPLPGQLIVSRRERLRWFLGKKFLSLASASIAAWLGLAALIAGRFHIVTSLGLIGNIVVIPAGLAIVCLGFSAALSSLLCAPIAVATNAVNRAVAWAMIFSVRWIAGIPCAWTYVPALGIAETVSFFGVMASAGFILSARFRREFLLPAVLFASASLSFPLLLVPDKPLLKMTFLDVGQGDSTYCEFPSGENMLIDGGPEEGLPAGRMVIKPFLQWKGRKGIDTVVLTHPHLDHISGLLTVLSDFSVGRLIVADWKDSSEEYARLLGMAFAKGIEIQMVRRGDCLARGEGLAITVLNPGPVPHNGTRSDLNNNSIALRIDYGDVSFLLAADMEGEAEKEVCMCGLPLRADILRVGHHGGRTASTAEFLARVSPGWAVISAGFRNRFGHPSADAIGRIRECGSGVLRTDLHGAVTIATDGKRISATARRSGDAAFLTQSSNSKHQNKSRLPPPPRLGESDDGPANPKSQTPATTSEGRSHETIQEVSGRVSSCGNPYRHRPCADWRHLADVQA